jgi:hypothetical protein
MERIPLKQDQETEKVFKHIFDNGLGVPITLDSAPTTSSDQLKDDYRMGFDGSNLYIRINKTTYKITLTAV